MFHLIKADIKSTKLISILKLIPAVIVLALFANEWNIHFYYPVIALITLGLCIESFSKQKKNGDQLLVISLPVTRKEYIIAKYIIIIPWFIIASFIMTVWILLFDKNLYFFNFNYWMITFLLTVIIATYYFIVYQISHAAALILFAALISITITLNLPEKFYHISHYSLYPIALIITFISYLIIIIRFQKTDIT
ncbi:ABC-2 transporter permease [Lederbergia lenta]|uniref:Uncharacterized protein n=1 Tax=Lederbergia lenta TaxID=1467 RepID=A0A2X4VPZ6_LEDLE|nr:ABC-2 transporter permease [Lederbergia lenta]MCM3111001.1 ABC-2 transporter permease [Lederbergia lenta]MEC2325610.1 ABC-2 transporter permease [Lederbergia lenta]SQI54166.1 Uncharacterised protein [Lederbergia lenta]